LFSVPFPAWLKLDLCQILRNQSPKKSFRKA